MDKPNYPDCFRPLATKPTVCYWWIFRYDETCIPGEEDLNENSGCGITDQPCPSGGEKPAVKGATMTVEVP